MYQLNTLTAAIQHGEIIFTAYGSRASQYLYKKELRSRVMECYEAAKRCDNRFYVLRGIDVIAAQSTESGALQYVGDNGAEVIVDFCEVLPSLYMLDRIVRKAEATEANPIIFGNVEFWIDSDCKWNGFKGQMAFNLPLNKWNSAAITRDITAHLSGVERA